MRGASLILLFVAFSAPLVAGEEESAVDRAAVLLTAGRYGDAQALLDSAREENPSDPLLAAALGDLMLETGRIEEAGKVARAGGDDTLCRVILAETLLLTGHPEDASALLQKALRRDPEHVRARYMLGMAELDLADRDSALDTFEWLFDYYAKNTITDPEALTLIAAASIRVAELTPDEQMDFGVTAKLLDSVLQEHPDYLPAYIVKGEIYLGAYQDQEAKTHCFEKALKRNPRYPPALLGLAEQSAFHMNDQGGVKHCEEALLTNPNLFAATEFIARSRIGDSEYDEAVALIDRVLAVNPRRKPALALRAAVAYCRGEMESFESQVAAVLELDPHFGQVYWELTGILEQQRRFKDAADLAAKATEVAPKDFRGWWALGRNLVHIAEETRAKEALDKSKALDPFGHYLGNPFRENMAEVLGHLEEFVETRTDNFVYKIHVGENEVLSRYYHRFMENSYRLLTEKYGFKPEGPILTEIFHIHADFAARTIGLPGIGALGACFGQVITLDSPSSRRPGEFGWASTAHHEFAHVITLQLSKGRVPRWFTEGLSVYEERQFADWWERDMDSRLYDAFMNDSIYKIENFNGVFRGRDVLFAYYLGGMMCEFLDVEFGFDKIVAMLKAYGEDMQTTEVLKKALGVTPAEYDAAFRKWVGKYVSGWRMMPNISSERMRKAKERLEEAPKDFDALLTVAWAFHQRGNDVDALTYLGRAIEKNAEHPSLHLLRGSMAMRAGRTDRAKVWYEKFLESGEDDFRARLNLAKIAEQAGDFEAAMAHYKAAKKCFPSYTGPDGPYLNLARLLKGEEDLAGAMAEIEQHARLANTDIGSRMELASWYESREDWSSLAAILTEVVRIYPLGAGSVMPVHARLGMSLRKLDRLEEAVQEYEVALALGAPEGEANGLRLDLGEILFLLGRLDDARFHARSILDSDPENEAARKLLEKSTEE
jgi:tetratricopeptide (TPR) repeat protein